MEDGADRVEALRLTLESIQKCIGLLVIYKSKRGEILPFGVLAENVGDEDVLLTTQVKGVDDGAADEPGAAGDENGG